MIALHIALGAFNAGFTGYNAIGGKLWWAAFSLFGLALNGFGIWAHSA